MHAKQWTMYWSLCRIHALPTICWYWQLLSGQNVNRKSRKRGDGQERGDNNNCLQNTPLKTKDCATRTLLNPRVISPIVFSGVRVTRSLVFYVMFCKSLSFCPFSFGHCCVCLSVICGFWLPFWYLQTLLKFDNILYMW